MPKKFRHELLKQMITLSTAGFGIVAALAWNDAVQAFVDNYINKYLSVGSGIISKFIYAFFITLIAVLITYELTKIIDEDKEKEADK
ncbi:MAG TPA: DUF5654 family protein [Candidatus Saccharimonadales bacterium]|nr:DUF5654 family protein [Candidatus Saccharimonadales bacterium]